MVISAFDWFMLAAWSISLMILVNTSILFEPAAKAPDAIDQDKAIGARLETIEGKLDRPLERQP